VVDMASAYHAYWRAASPAAPGPARGGCVLPGAEGRRTCSAAASARVANRRIGLGYNFDGCAPETLRSSASVKDGQLCSRRHELPRARPSERDTMIISAAQAEDLVNAGATSSARAR